MRSDCDFDGGTLERADKEAEGKPIMETEEPLPDPTPKPTTRQTKNPTDEPPPRPTPSSTKEDASDHHKAGEAAEQGHDASADEDADRKAASETIRAVPYHESAVIIGNIFPRASAHCRR